MIPSSEGLRPACLMALAYTEPPPACQADGGYELVYQLFIVESLMISPPPGNFSG